ncbi:uncharacterized protein Pyn_27093 [Prunus yedoensis var. nudiflora]|uniref:ARM repeat N-terminal plant domain-containing protein n=1 Tax=Prunus yedoensis var. nudiflora TaxID=2094558 RepID=A0A314XN20_PRUYE|nr:uncharacterized protein Pyn_27093 [Prunus yedoensis var. nudiflora]
MDSLKQKEQACTRPFCFFCTMKEPDSFKRRAGISACFKELPLGEDQGNVLVLSSLWQIAMTHPDDPEFPSLGIFECMAKLIFKGINNKCWLQTDQNIYIPYYAAHVIGSYTMNKAEFAEKAVASGVIPPLLDLLRGKMSWVEQRVAARALGHLASYERTSEAVAQYEEEVVRSAMKVASTCLHVVYVSFVGVKDKRKRQKYHCDLLTRGVGGLEMEICKAEEWASQLQCWSLNILNCFACKEKSLNLICKQHFLKQLCGMWGGLANRSSPAGVGLIRILCYSKYGRKKISESREVIESLCNISRSSDDWQYMGIDCLLLLLNDPDTRYKVIDIAALFLVDLVELRSLGDRSNLGETITKALLLANYKQGKLNKNRKIEKNLEELWNLKVERRKRERGLCQEKIEKRMVLVDITKQEANHMFCLGEIEEAIVKYSEALELCPLGLRKERMVLYSNRAQCQLLMRDSDAAIRDSTRALCLSTPVNSHSKSLWRRSQAYDMKGLAKESLMDCLAFINGCIKSESSRRVKIPHYAARMISKQMEATWLFATARSTMATRQDFQVMKQVQELEGKGNLCESGDDKQDYRDEITRVMMEKKGLSTILEEPLIVKEESGRKMERTRRV